MPTFTDYRESIIITKAILQGKEKTNTIPKP